MSLTYSVHSLVWDNVAPAVLEAHRSVTQHFAIPVRYYQENTTHGIWLDRVMNQSQEEVVGFFDIDAVPVNSEITCLAAEYALTNQTFVGLAQAANHIEPAHIYAGPGFFFIYRNAWISLGRPTFLHGGNSDVGQNVSRAAERAGLKYRCLYPTHWDRQAIEGIWPLGNYGRFAIGTHYRGGVYHLYQSRFNYNVDLFVSRCAEIVEGRFTTDGMQPTFDDAMGSP